MSNDQQLETQWLASVRFVGDGVGELRWFGIRVLPPRRRLVTYLIAIYVTLLIQQIVSYVLLSFDMPLLELGLFTILAGIFVAVCADILQEKTRHRRDRDQARSQLEATLRSSTDGVFVTRLEDGLILDSSPGGEKLFGYSREEMIGRTTRELGLWVHDHDRDDYKDQMIQNLTIAGFACQLKGRGGDPFRALVSGTILNYDGQVCILNVVRAVEREYQLQRQTEEYNSLVRQITDSLPIILARHDEQMRYIYVNQAAEAVTGMSAEDFMNKTVREVGIEPELCSRLEAAMKKVLETGVTESLSYTLEGQQGSRILRTHVHPNRDESGVVNSLTTVTRDITQEAHAVESLKDSRERYRFLAQNSADMICRHEADGRFIYVSPSSERLLGYKPEDLVGKNAYELFHPEDLNQIEQSHRLMQSPGGVSTVSYRLKRADGDYVWLETTSQSVPTNRNPESYEIITISRNISDRKATEAALAWELELNASMAMLSQFAVREDDFKQLSLMVLDAFKSMTESPAASILMDSGQGSQYEMFGEGSLLRMLGQAIRDEETKEDDTPFPRIRTGVMANNPKEIARVFHCEQLPENQVYSILAVPLFIGGQNVGVLAVMNSDRAYTLRDIEVGERMAELLALVISREQAQAEQRKIETYYRAGAESSLDAFYVLQAMRDSEGQPHDFVIVDVNRRGCELLSASREEIVGCSLIENYPLVIEQGYFDLYKQVLESGEPQQRELQIDAEEYGIHAAWLQVQAVPLDDGIAVSLRDISGRKLSEQSLRESREHYRHTAESNRRLLTEVNHRVRNNLAGLLSLIRMTSKNVMNVTDFAEAMKQRITAMSHVHNMLAQTAWNDLAFKQMLSSLSQATASHHEHQIALLSEGPDVMITPQQATPLAMMLSELFNNSVKHGAHSQPTGRIEITWDIGEYEDYPCCMDLRWTESGGPDLQYPIRRSLGLQLIEGFVRFELAGECEMNFEKNGVKHRFVIPLDPSQVIEPETQS